MAGNQYEMHDDGKDETMREGEKTSKLNTICKTIESKTIVKTEQETNQVEDNKAEETLHLERSQGGRVAKETKRGTPSNNSRTSTLGKLFEKMG